MNRDDRRIQVHVEEDLAGWPRVSADALRNAFYGLVAVFLGLLVLVAITARPA